MSHKENERERSPNNRITNKVGKSNGRSPVHPDSDEDVDSIYSPKRVQNPTEETRPNDMTVSNPARTRKNKFPPVVEVQTKAKYPAETIQHSDKILIEPESASSVSKDSLFVSPSSRFRTVPKPSKFNTPGVYRRVLEPTDHLFRADRSNPSSKGNSTENLDTDKLILTEATSESSHSHQTSRIFSGVESTNQSLIMDRKKPKTKSKRKAKKGRNSTDVDESEGGQTAPEPEPETVVDVIHPPKPALRRTDAQEDLIEETNDGVQTTLPGPSRKNPVKKTPKRKPLATGLTVSGSQLRKNHFDGMISKMKEWPPPQKDPDKAKNKPPIVTNRKGLKKQPHLRFAPRNARVHPDESTTNLEIPGINKINMLTPAGRVMKANLKRALQAKKKEAVAVEIDGDDPPVKSRKVKSKGKKGRRSTVMRVRAPNGRVSFKFTPLEDFGPDDDLDNIGRDSVTKAENIKDWMRTARRSLPSAVGIPVQYADEVMSAGIPVVASAYRHSLNPVDAYNSIYEDMQKHHESSHSRRVSLRRSIYQPNVETDADLSQISITQSTAGPTITKKVAALRLLAEHLSKKIKHKQNYVLVVQNKLDFRDKENSLRGLIGRFGIKVHRWLHQAFRACTIWKTDIHQIHGKYGLSAAAYFEWIRKIVTMNIIYFLFTFVLVIVPEVIDDTNLGIPISNSSTCFIPPDPMCPNSLPRPVIPPKEPFMFQDLLIGNGYLEHSYLYYSGYRDPGADPSCPIHRGNVNRTETDSVFALTGFRLSFVCLLIFVMNSIYISIQVTHFYQVTRLESRVPGLTRKDHFKAILCAWDFNCSDESAAKALHRSIWHELKELVVGIENMKSKTAVKAKEGRCFSVLLDRFGLKVAKYILHWFVNTFIVIASLLAGALVYFSYYVRIWYRSGGDSCNPINPPNWVLALPSIFVSFTTYGMSRICVWISSFENWDSIENRNWAIMGRIGFYYVLELFVLYGYWLYHSKSLEEKVCYEEIFGEDLYRLVVFQAIIELGGSALIKTAYHYYKKRRDPNYQKPEFDSARLTLSLFFMHTLAGFGFFFCPLISLLVIGRLIATFYHRKYKLLHWSSYPQHLSHNSEISAPYLVVFFVTYLISSFLNVFLVAEYGDHFNCRSIQSISDSLYPSSICGPFSHYRENSLSDTSHGADGHYYDVFVDGFTSSASSLLMLLVKPAVGVVFIMILAGLCHTFRAWAGAYVITMEKMHSLLLLERQDRDFLLQSIFKIVKKQNALDRDDHDDEHEKNDVNAANPGTKIEEEGDQESEDWEAMAVTLGIFNSRRGTMAKRNSFDADIADRLLDSSGGHHGQPKVSVDYSGRSIKSEDWSGINQVIEEAVAPSTRHHATFRRESVDAWVEDFLTSKRSQRRSAAVVLDSDRKAIARRFGIEIREQGSSDDDEDEDN